jgi:hypothetical protein
LGIDQGHYSPHVLKKIVYAGAQHPSFAQGSAALAALAGLKIGTKQVERVTEKIGRERVGQRDREIEEFRKTPLMTRCQSPVPNPPDLAVVEMDGGRLQILDRRAGVPDPVTPSDPADGIEDEDEPEEARGHWREDKIGLLMTMTGKTFSDDPCPEVPEHFVDPTRILKLARQIKGSVAVAEDAAGGPPGSAPVDEPVAAAEFTPKPRVRTTVATRGKAKQFAPILAQAAYARGFARAKRKAFVADGAATNWKTHKQWFSDYTAVVDFIHALSYVFAAAMAGRSFRAGWEAYVAWIQQVWGGRVGEVITALEARQSVLGIPGPDDPETGPRVVVAEALTYLRNNASRMRYPDYRKAGLPITSSHMESTVKLFNRRVKGSEKFWSEAGAEAILQLRADYLSETEPLDRFWEDRQACATGRRCYRRSG